MLCTAIRTSWGDLTTKYRLPLSLGLRSLVTVGLATDFGNGKILPKRAIKGAIGSNRIENGEKGAKNGSKGHLRQKEL